MNINIVSAAEIGKYVGTLMLSTISDPKTLGMVSKKD